MMRGLLLKDIMNLRQQGLSYLVVVAVWGVLGISQDNIGFFGGITVMLAFFCPLNAIAYDSKAGWEPYALTMPVSRGMLVLSKYLLALIAAAAGAVLTDIAGIIITKDPAESLFASVLIMCAAIAITSIYLPMIFKYGPEKGRMYIFAMIVATVLIIVVGQRLGITLPRLGFLEGPMLLPAAGLAAAAVLAASVGVSVGIYRKKEF